jgi:hypothetical protein
LEVDSCGYADGEYSGKERHQIGKQGGVLHRENENKSKG